VVFSSSRISVRLLGRYKLLRAPLCWRMLLLHLSLPCTSLSLHLHACRSPPPYSLSLENHQSCISSLERGGSCEALFLLNSSLVELTRTMASRAWKVNTGKERKRSLQEERGCPCFYISLQEERGCPCFSSTRQGKKDSVIGVEECLKDDRLVFAAESFTID